MASIQEKHQHGESLIFSWIRILPKKNKYIDHQPLIAKADKKRLGLNI